jgi:hypothetical protein
VDFPVGGKAHKDHLEALDHYQAMLYIRQLGRHSEPLTEGDVRNLHSLVVQRSQPDIAGRYDDLPLCAHRLIRAGYPPIAVRPEDRLSYTRALQRSEAGQGTAELERLLYERLAATLVEYLSALNEARKPGTAHGSPEPGA